MNPKWTGIELDYNTLPLHTRYRFAEMEIARAIPILTNIEDRKHFGNYDTIASRIFRRIQENNYLSEHEEEFITLVKSQAFRTINKQAQVIYFRYRNISYSNIRQATGMSPNTISRAQYQQVDFYPAYPRWDEYMLARWDEIKGAINIWNESLYHMK